MGSNTGSFSRAEITGALVAMLVLAACTVSASDDRYHRSVGISAVFADNNDEFKADSPKQGDRDEFRQDQKKESAGKKSVVKAALLSALLPGAGEYYLGNRGKARYFFTVEAVSWAGCIAFRTYGHWRKDDYIRYAKTYANASLEDKSEEFRDMVGFYRSIDDYNSLGRVWDPQRPYLYDTPDNHWRWQSDADQATYRNLKNRSREAYRRAKFMIGIAVANRIVSVLDAIRDARRAKRSLDHSFSQEKPFQIQFSSFDDGAQVQLALRTPF
jgi:hypothetical protein